MGTRGKTRGGKARPRSGARAGSAAGTGRAGPRDEGRAPLLPSQVTSYISETFAILLPAPPPSVTRSSRRRGPHWRRGRARPARAVSSPPAGGRATRSPSSRGGISPAAAPPQARVPRAGAKAAPCAPLRSAPLRRAAWFPFPRAPVSSPEPARGTRAPAGLSAARRPPLLRLPSQRRVEPACVHHSLCSVSLSLSYLVSKGACLRCLPTPQ